MLHALCRQLRLTIDLPMDGGLQQVEAWFAKSFAVDGECLLTGLLKRKPRCSGD
jgi:hypothetical protein